MSSKTDLQEGELQHANSTGKTDQLERTHLQRQGQYLTSDTGVPINDTDNSLRVGPGTGPTLMEDFHFREKIMRFDHERIPERVVHARGSGAHGYFQVYESLAEYTKADFLQDPSKKTPVFVRFSTVGGSKGSPDTVRDVRGFAVKFYTEQGNFDLVGNNIPVFFIQDAIKFPDLIHSVKPEPHHEIPQASSAHDSFWDFVGLMPESAHMIFWHLSDRAIPRSYRTMEGFGVHSFRLVNAQGKSRFVKFHWKPLLGLHSLVWDEAQKINGKDIDFHRRDLWEAIEKGQYPEWELGLQIVDEGEEAKFDFDILDSTKIIPEELVPVKRVGKLVLNRNPNNFFAETEQIAFCTSHLVPGIEASDDPLLQGRMFSYFDTQLTRLGGPNFEQIPINRPICPVHNMNQDGFHQHLVKSSRVNYSPNSLAGNCPALVPDIKGGYVHYPQKVEGRKVRHRPDSFRDHYTQARLFWNSLTPVEKLHLTDAARFELGKVESIAIRQRVVDVILRPVDLTLAMLVAKAIGCNPPAESATATSAGSAPSYHSRSSAALSIEMSPRTTAATARVAILVADGVNGDDVAALVTALKGEGCEGVLVAPTLAAVSTASGGSLPVLKSFLVSTSVEYDAVFVPGGEGATKKLVASGDATHWLLEAFKHCKTIGASRDGIAVLRHANPALPSQPGVIVSSGAPDDKAFIQALRKRRHWDRIDQDGGLVWQSAPA